MKKTYSILLVLLLSFSLAACKRTSAPEASITPLEGNKNIVASNISANTDNNPALWTTDDPVWGDANAPISMVVFSDFQCPHCADFFMTLEKLQKGWIESGKLKIQHRDFPLGMHKNSVSAHAAANAAAKQGRYLEMHRMLFERQKDWQAVSNPSGLFEAMAREVKLNIDQYEKDRKDPALVVEIEEDKAAGQARGISGTPGFFLNGTAYEGAISYENLLKLLQEIK